MRTRILTLAAVFAVVFAVPSMASADITLSGPVATNGNAHLIWSDDGVGNTYTVLRADGGCGGTFNALPLEASPNSYDDGTLSSEGAYCYEVQGWDGTTTTTSNLVSVTYDITPPTGSVTAPASNASISTLAGPVTLTASPGDAGGSGVKSVRFEASPAGLSNFNPIGSLVTSSPWSITWSPADGTYDIEAVITDQAGNIYTTDPLTEDATSVLLDGTPPTGSITAPSDGSTIAGTTNTLSASISDATSGVFSVRFERSNDGGSSWTTIATSGSSSSPYTANWNTNSPSITGTWLVRAFATDNVGNTFGTGPVSVTVDHTGPVTAVTAPAPSAVLHGVVNLSATATDSSGVSTVIFEESANGSGVWNQILPTLTGSPYNSTWDTTGLTTGTYLVHAIATDSLGNPTTSSQVSVTVDNTNPTGTLTAPAPGASVNATATATATAGDVGSSVASVDFQSSPPGAGTWTTFATDTSGPYTAALSLLADGVYDLRVHVTDAVGNVGNSATVANVRVDKTAPSVTIGGVAGSTDVRGTLPLTATATDTGGSGIASVTYGRRVAGSSGAFTTIGTSSTGPTYPVPFDTTGIADGNYEIQALATDVAGNTAGNSVTNVLVDNHAPNTPSAPTGLTPVSAAPTITFTPSTDPTSGGVSSGIDHYDVYRGGVQVNAAPIPAAGPYTWSDVTGQSTTPAAGANTYSYTVVAVDTSGNASAQSPAKVIVLDPTAASAPTGLTASSPSNQHPVISWTAPASTPFTLDHYDVFRNGSASPVAAVLAGTTTFTDSGVSDGTYTYQVVAAASTDSTRGVASGSVTVVYDTTPPSAPTGVTATAAADGSINISWSASSDAGSGVARYVVRRALSSTAPATIADGDATCSGTATSCSDTTALNGKLYTYSVFAVDGVGNVSLAGVSAGVTAQDQTPPSVPKGLTATPGDGSVTLNWTAASASDDVAGYVLVAKQGSSAPTNETDGIRECSSLVASSTTCTATGLTNGVTYTFGLFALDEALNRSQPAVVSAAPNGKVTDSKGPAAVTKLHATVAGGKVTLTWKNPSDHDFDHVVITSATRKPDSAKASKRVYSGKGTKATIKLAPGSSRWFVVVAYDVVGNASSPASVHVAMPALSPFGPTPKAKVHGPVHLSWPTVKGAKYYNVQVYAGKKRISVSWPAGHSLTLPHAKLKKGTKYTWYVWPGLGAKANAHYGKLIGKNVFTFTG